MREKDCNLTLAKWDKKLPSPEVLTPLSQTLTTPDLDVAFEIQPNPQTQTNCDVIRLQRSSAVHRDPLPSHQPGSGDIDSSSELGCGCGGGGGASARTRLVWTPQLHKRFVDAVAHLGIKNAVPETIMQLMSVDGLTRENVASHLQKYRLHLKRVQGFNCSGAGNSATDRLLASCPVPPHFLPSKDDYNTGYAPPAAKPSPAADMVSGGQNHYRQMGTFEDQEWKVNSDLDKELLPLTLRTVCTTMSDPSYMVASGEDVLQHPSNPVKEGVLINDTIMEKMEDGLSKGRIMEEMKDCCSVFFLLPKEYEFEKDTLIQLWMAGGYIKDELMGQECFYFLISEECIFCCGTNFVTRKDRYQMNIKKIKGVG